MRKLCLLCCVLVLGLVLGSVILARAAPLKPAPGKGKATTAKAVKPAADKAKAANAAAAAKAKATSATVVPEPVTPAAPLDKALAAEVTRLIDQLGDDDYRQRVQANERLHKLGAPILGELRKALGNPDAEIRRQVHQLIPAIETESYVAPKRVTLHARNKTLRQIMDEIGKQTGYKIDLWTKNAKQVFSYDFKDATFWEVIDRISEDAHLVMQQQYGEAKVMLQQQDKHQDYVQHWGAFNFYPINLQHYKTIQLTPGADASQGYQRNESLNVAFMIVSEPRIPILGLGEVRLLSAYDNEKNSMLPHANPGMYPGMWGGRMWISRYGNGNRSNFMQSNLQLNRPSEKATKIKELRGLVQATLLVEQKPIVVTDKVLSAKDKKVTIGTTTFHFENITQPNKNQKQYQIQISISEDNKDNPNDYTWMNSIYQRIELQDEDGNKYMNFGTSWNNMSPNNVQMTLTYGPMGNGNIKPPSKFVFQHWKTIQYNIEFTLKDLPLP